MMRMPPDVEPVEYNPDEYPHEEWRSLFRTGLSWVVGFGIVLVLIVMAISFALAHDLGQWENIAPAIRNWYAGLMQPDNPTVSCCGEGDAYWADEAHVEHLDDGTDRVIAVITDDRDDEPLHRIHENIGKRYVIPERKIKWDKGNPTGHVILFLGTVVWDHGEPQGRAVLCYVMSGGV